MIKLLIAAILSGVSVVCWGQFGGHAGIGGKAGTGGGYVAPVGPAFTNDWPMWGASNTCGSGVACTNTAGLRLAVDAAGSNNATQTNGSQQPEYLTSQINSLAAISPGGSNNLPFASTFCQSGCTMTWFAVMAPNTSNTAAIVGNITSNGGFTWRVNSSGHQEIDQQGTALIAQGTVTLTNAAWVGLIAQYNETTGAYAFYECATGSTNADASGTATSSLTEPISSIGASAADSSGGTIAEIGYLNTTTTAGLCSYVNTTYGK